MARPNQKILLIDDNEDLLSLLQLSLETHGFRVLTAHSGPIALEIMAKDKVDLIVVDYKMPEMDGERVAEEIRRVSPLTPILMYSGALEELPARVLELVDEFVSKQEPFSNLLYHINTVGRRTHRHRRVFARFPIHMPFLVIYDGAPGSAVFYAESTDLSEGGIGGVLEEETEIAVDGLALVRIVISADQALTARASLRHRIGNRCGFQFLNLSAPQRQMIRASLAWKAL